MPETKLRTLGVSPKVIGQTAAWIAAYIAARFGVELDPELAALTATVAGLIAGYWLPPGQTTGPETVALVEAERRAMEADEAREAAERELAAAQGAGVRPDTPEH